MEHPIYPEPRLLAQSGLGARVQTACVDTRALANHDALDRLVPELLAEAGLVLGDEPCECDLAIAYAAFAPALPADAQALWLAAGDNPERFIVVTRSKNGGATAILFAPGIERAALYALRATLALVQGAPTRIANAVVVDYPVFRTRGVVEGFYGLPYSVTDRTALLRLMSRLRENAFIYGPKNDPYARDLWREPYPLRGVGEGAGQTIEAAAHEADRLLVDFIWSVSPGLSFDFNHFDAELDALKAKIDEVRGLGARRFALFLDDILLADAANHARLMNALDDYIHRFDPSARLITVGTRYSFGPNDYTDALGTSAHSDIEIMWTGNTIEPATMTATDLATINASLRRKVTIWDNWPNLPGSFHGRSGDLHSAVQGYFTNPVLNELSLHPPVVFFQVLGPIADYLWYPEGYSGNSSYEAWRPVLSRVIQWVAPCPPCGNLRAGWTCSAEGTAILFCDGRCVTALPCPGGCERQSDPHPHICH